jgi:hypothetical protein
MFQFMATLPIKSYRCAEARTNATSTVKRFGSGFSSRFRPYPGWIIRAAEERASMSEYTFSSIQHGCTGDGSCDFILTPAEIASLLRVHTSWVYQHQHELPIFNVGRYVRCRCGELRLFVRNHRGQRA